MGIKVSGLSRPFFASAKEKKKGVGIIFGKYVILPIENQLKNKEGPFILLKNTIARVLLTVGTVYAAEQQQKTYFRISLKHGNTLKKGKLYLEERQISYWQINKVDRQAGVILTFM
ncbi:hypothetical protein KIL84_017146 [Mauremys mutica]|uniref:Uncharacterized protein n=1 Tax=Mauremys mutica TaxID=74926 RepID=A0A9D4ARD6_9SAUR|nr:hypothetical protein KIL84_017146 [Mauremys mutica]